jgi:hypothetical protein
MANEFIARNGIVALNNSTITGSLDIAGNLTTTGTITAQKLVVQQVTSSVVYSSGSNVFGNSLSNIQSMTGSVNITGSLTVNGVNADLNNYITLDTTQTISGTKTFTGLNKSDNEFLLKNLVGSPGTAAGYTSIRGYSISGTTKGISFVDPTLNGASLLFDNTAGYVYTFPSATGTLALTSNLSAYLPLTGGTLTGALGGTSATFSSSVMAANYSTTALSITPSLNLTYSETSGLKIHYNASNAVSYIDNYYETTVNSLVYGDIQFRTKTLSGTSLVPSLTIRGYTGNVLIGTETDLGNQKLQIKTTSGSNYLRMQTDVGAYDCAMFYTDGTDSVYSGMMKGSTGLSGAYTIWAGGNARINVLSNGNVLIGTTTDNGAKLQVNGVGSFAGTLYTTTGNGIIIGGTSFAFAPDSTRGSLQIVGSTDRVLSFGTNGNQDIYIYSSSILTQIVSTPEFKLVVNGLVRLTVATTGAATFSSTVTATNFITTSDRRLKFEIKEIKDAISKLSKFKAYEYIKDNKQDAGFIAQEVQEVLPYSVNTMDNGYLSMNDRPILALIHQAIIEINERLTKLENASTY